MEDLAEKKPGGMSMVVIVVRLTKARFAVWATKKSLAYSRQNPGGRLCLTNEGEET